jgi:alanine racemase
MNKWVEIDEEKCRRNLTAVMQSVPEGVILMAVLKNNAYGQGAVGTGQLMARLGVTYFGVSYLEEALELREAGLDTDILIFSPLAAQEDVRVAFERDLTVTVASEPDLALVRLASGLPGFRLRVHVKMDTGLTRFGLPLEQMVPVCQALRACERVSLEGVYTHMADPGSRAFTERQFALFQKGISLCEQAGLRFPLRHCAGSEVFLRYPDMRLDMVRLGTLLFGQYPAGYRPPAGAPRLEDPFAFKTRVAAVNDRPARAYLGYKRGYRLKRPARVAVLPVGYADGVALEVGNPPSGWWELIKKLVKQILTFLTVRRFTLYVRAKNARAPVRGKVFMQMTLLELPPGLALQPGDEVEVPVRKTLIGKEVARFTMRSGEAGKRGNFYLAGGRERLERRGE